MWILFVDFSKAYDKVPRSMLLHELKEAGCGKQFLTMIKAIYTCTKFIPKSAIISVSMGIKQGSPLSCLLFVFYLDKLVRKINTFGQDGFLGSLHALLLMDDTAIISTSRQACIKKLNLLLSFCSSHGMEVNESKTQFMVINGDTENQTDIVCRNLVVQYCKCYWYLGSPITDDAKPSSVMREHIKAKNKHVLKFVSFLRSNYNMPFIGKRKVAEACILSALLCGVDTWLTSNFRELVVLYNNILSSLYWVFVGQLLMTFVILRVVCLR